MQLIETSHPTFIDTTIRPIDYPDIQEAEASVDTIQQALSLTDPCGDGFIDLHQELTLAKFERVEAYRRAGLDEQADELAREI